MARATNTKNICGPHKPDIANKVSKALFAKAGRKYGVNNRRDSFLRMNAKDKDGNVKRCRACNSHWHFIRDCHKTKKASLVNLVLNLEVEESESLSTNDILDVIQELPDDVWLGVSDQLPNSPELETSVPRTVYTRLVMIADQLELIKEKVMCNPLPHSSR